MSDYYSREELKDMPPGTALGDENGDLWVRGIQGKWVHDSGSGLLGCTAPPLLKHEPTEPPLSDDQAHHPAPTLGELLQALEYYMGLPEKTRADRHRERAVAIQKLIDERIGLK